MKSPLDVSGYNASLPPPLRFVSFCPVHYKTWIPHALKTMQTRVVLSHIVFGAKPCFGAVEKPEDESERRKPVKKRRKK